MQAHTIPKPLNDWIRALDAIQGLADPPGITHAWLIDNLALSQGDGPALIGIDTSFSRCIVCAVDEVGEAVKKVTDAAASPTNRFDGYTVSVASQRKVLAGVFATGDRWFRTGDLMRKDASGFFYFVDRIDDSFRWRGENVSTTSVAIALRSCPGIIDAVVYGVAVPHNEDAREWRPS